MKADISEKQRQLPAWHMLAPTFIQDSVCSLLMRTQFLWGNFENQARLVLLTRKLEQNYLAAESSRLINPNTWIWLHGPLTLSLCVLFIALPCKIPATGWQRADFPLVLVTEIFFVRPLLWLTLRSTLSPPVVGLLVYPSKVFLLLHPFLFRERYVHGMSVVLAASYVSHPNIF